jgi:hypothetical protein
MFEDLNTSDLDVAAPPSSSDHFKEVQLADKLDQYLDQLIREGFFNDCEPRGRYLNCGNQQADGDCNRNIER